MAYNDTCEAIASATRAKVMAHLESRSTDYPITIPHILYKQTVKARISYCMYTNKMLKVIMTKDG